MHPPTPHGRVPGIRSLTAAPTDSPSRQPGQEPLISQPHPFSPSELALGMPYTVIAYVAGQRSDLRRMAYVDPRGVMTPISAMAYGDTVIGTAESLAASPLTTGVAGTVLPLEALALGALTALGTAPGTLEPAALYRSLGVTADRFDATTSGGLLALTLEVIAAVVMA